MAEAFHKSETEHANIVDKLKERDAELTNKLAQAQAELSATMDGLHNARIEIENLRESSKKTKKIKNDLFFISNAPKRFHRPKQT